MIDPLHSSILVTGAGGQLGRRIVELLLEAGATGVIAGSRKPEQLAALGVPARKVDFDDPAGLDAAFAGVDQIIIVSTDIFGEGRQKQHLAAVAAAARAGVGHIVYTSLTNPGRDSPVLLAPDHRMTEEALAATGLPYTILRNAVYMDGLLASLPSVLASGQWYTAAGQGRIARVAREDCARIAAAVLAAGPKGQRTIDVTGPDLLTTDEIAAVASDVLGKPITVVHVPDEALAAGMVGAGLPPIVAELLVSFEKATRLGQSDVSSRAVEDLTGAPPVGVREFLVAHRQVLLG